MPSGAGNGHDGSVSQAEELTAAVETAFERTGRGLTSWPDPHPDRSPADDEYSRLTDPERWRIVRARAEAWIVALTGVGLATVERDVTVNWTEPPRTDITGSDRLVPLTPGALPVVLSRSRIGPVADAGITLGVGEPTVPVAWFPDCGCDACDSGSGNELDHLDAHLRGIVNGAFRRLDAGDRQITTIGDGGWSSMGRFRRGEQEAVLADPAGWRELSGRPWIDPTR